MLLILGVGRLVYWLEPWGISVDESTYLAVAEAWHHYGKLYVDAIDRKPPLVYGLYNLIGQIFGFWNIHGPHITAFLITLFLCWLAERVAKSLPRPPRPGFTAILYAVISACFVREFICANSEIALLIPLGLSYWILIKKDWNTLSPTSFFYWMTLAAALAAISTLLKQVAALPFALSTIAIGIYLLKKMHYPRAFVLTVATLVGVTLVYATTAYLFYRAGSFDDFVYWNLTDNFAYIADAKLLDKNPRPIFSPVLVTIAAWPALWWAFAYALRYRRKDFLELKSLIALTGVIGGFGIVYVSGRLFSHYFVPVSWLFVIFTSPYLSELFEGRYRKQIAYLLAIPFACCFAVTTFRDPIFNTLNPNKPSHTFDQAMQARLLRTAEKIKANSNEGDRIVVWGMASQLYIMSERGSGTRFIPADYVSGRLGGMHSPAKRPAPHAMELYLEDMKIKRPQFFIDTSTAQLNDYQWFPISNYPELIQFLNANYELAFNYEGFDFWKLKPSVQNY